MVRKKPEGEQCVKCRKGLMLHPKLNIWICSFCGYAYEIAPLTGEIRELSSTVVRDYGK